MSLNLYQCEGMENQSYTWRVLIELKSFILDVITVKEKHFIWEDDG